MKEKQKSFWWEADKGKVHELVFNSLKHWDYKQSQRSEENLRNFRLYGNSEVLGLRAGEFQKIRSLNKLTLNIVQSAIDTATARIAKNRPKPTFLTEDGLWEMGTKARNLEKYISGSFYQMDIYNKGIDIFRDAGVFGDGILHFFINNKNQIDCERVFPEEIVVDEDEAIYGEPRQMHRVKFLTKDVVSSMFPKHKIAIHSSSTDAEGSFLYDQFTPDIIKVVESWRLPIMGMDKNGKETILEKGRHCISVQHGTMLDEEYDVDYFPFEKFGWAPRLLGYWAQGISEQLTGIQIEMNKILKTIQLSLHLGGVPKIFLEHGSEVVETQLNNEVGSLIYFSGTMPESRQLMNVPPELFLQLDKLYARAYEIIGLSQMSATSKKEPGLDSGKALRTFHDIESERFSVVSQRWEDFYMRCSKKVIKMSKQQAKDNPKMAVKALGQNGLRLIKWEDVHMDDDSYIMKVYPTNLLQDTPSGKLADIQDLMSINFLNKRQAYSLLDYPDLKAVTQLETAIVNDINATIEDIVDEGKYSAPEEIQDLEYALPVMQSAYLRYKRMNLPEEKLELFIRWIDDAILIINPPVEEPTIDPLEEGVVPEEEALDQLSEVAPIPTEGALPESL